MLESQRRGKPITQSQSLCMNTMGGFGYRTKAPRARAREDPRPGGPRRLGTKKIKEALRTCVLPAMERRLSIRQFYCAIRTAAFTRAVLRGNAPPIPLPPCLRSANSPPTIRASHTSYYLNRALRYLARALASPKWKDRCRIQGLEQVRKAQEEGVPHILAFCHFGPYHLLPFWLRAAGLPVTAFLGGKSNAGPGPAWFEDRVSPCREMPTVFYEDQMREVIKSLAAGNWLLMAIDSGAGHRVDVPVGNGWSFPMATGAIRLACRHRARLISCCIIDEGRWRFRIELGRAAPTPYLAGNEDWTRAGRHLLDEMLIHFRSYPSQCSSGLVRSFQPRRDQTAALTKYRPRTCCGVRE